MGDETSHSVNEEAIRTHEHLHDDIIKNTIRRLSMMFTANAKNTSDFAFLSSNP